MNSSGEGQVLDSLSLPRENPNLTFDCVPGCESSKDGARPEKITVKDFLKKLFDVSYDWATG